MTSVLTAFPASELEPLRAWITGALLATRRVSPEAAHDLAKAALGILLSVLRTAQGRQEVDVEVIWRQDSVELRLGPRPQPGVPASTVVLLHPAPPVASTRPQQPSRRPRLQGSSQGSSQASSQGSSRTATRNVSAG